MVTDFSRVSMIVAPDEAGKSATSRLMFRLMGLEASKTKRIWPESIIRLMQGQGIDIGCGPDPVLPGIDRFDQEQGDANEITRYVQKKYDFVFSSHTLEHMRDPLHALREWVTLLKPGGHAIILVPDEDLYEQGCWPSVFNSDHKWTFTLEKAKSWSPKSVNVVDLAKQIQGVELVSLELQDHGYDRSLLSHSPGRWGRRLGRIATKLMKRFPQREQKIAKISRMFGALVDQTDMKSTERLAQIQFILCKTEA